MLKIHHNSVFFFQAEDGIRDGTETGVQTCALPICEAAKRKSPSGRRARTALGAKQAESLAEEPPRRAEERPAPIDAGAARKPGRARSGEPVRKDRSEERRVGKECRTRWSTDQ